MPRMLLLVKNNRMFAEALPSQISGGAAAICEGVQPLNQHDSQESGGIRAVFDGN